MRSALATVLVGLMSTAACSGDGGSSNGSGGTTLVEPNFPTSGDDTDSEGVDEQAPSDLCGAAPSVGTGRTLGTLRGMGPDLGGACGNGGPTAFVVIDVPRRSDVGLTASGVAYQPQIGVLSGECVGDWVDRVLLCVPGGPGWVLDVAAGTTLIVVVGIDPDDPARQIIPTDGHDPLDFALDVRLRNVLSPGEPCGDSQGRCASGSACLSPSDGSAPVCTTLDSDTCQSAEEFLIEPGVQALHVDRAALQTDAHEHSCAGQRRAERVMQLGFDGIALEGRELRVRADDRDVALALRAPGCGLSEEIACAPDDNAGAQLEVADLQAALGGGNSAFLFVELPAEGSDGDPETSIEVELSGE